MKRLSALLLALLAGAAAAQSCSEAALPQMPGVWKQAMKGSSNGVPAKDLALQGKVFASLYAMLKQNYSPLGLTASQGGWQRTRATDQRPDSYGYSVYFLPFYCEGAATKTETHTGTVLYIHVNEADFIFSKSATERYFLDESERANYAWLKSMPQARDGVLHFKLATDPNEGANAREDKWLVTYDGQLPFRYVSRKEYLDDSARLFASLRVRELNKVDSDFKDNPQRRDKALAATRQHIDGQLAVIDKWSKTLSATELQLPAIVSSFEEFKGFLNEGERGAVILIKDKPEYYKRQLPTSIPQLITVHFKAVTTRPVHARAYADALQAVDFVLLKSLLGKAPGTVRAAP